MERSSPSRTAGIAVREVTIQGNVYLLSQPTKVRKAADEEAVIIARRLDMLPTLARACENLPEESRAAWRRDYISVMTCGIASLEEWRAYYGSVWQFAFNFWCALDPKHKVDPNSHPRDPRPMSLIDGVLWSYNLLEGAETAEQEAVVLATKLVSQEEALGESPGSTETASTPSMATPDTEAGPRSTTSSQKEDGAEKKS